MQRIWKGIFSKAFLQPSSTGELVLRLMECLQNDVEVEERGTRRDNFDTFYLYTLGIKRYDVYKQGHKRRLVKKRVGRDELVRDSC